MSKRTSITLDVEDLEYIEQLKKENFYNKSYADLYRSLVKLGIAQMQKQKKGK